MSSDSIVSWIDELHYFAFFLLGFVGTSFTPLPDPVLFFSSGYFAKKLILSPIITFLLAYLGFMLSLYGKYLIGRYSGKYAKRYLEKNERMKKNTKRAESLISKYGGVSIVISFFLPIIRHILPILLGMSKYSHKRYILITLSFGFLWTLIIYIAGFIWF